MIMSFGSHYHVLQWYQLPLGRKFCSVLKAWKKFAINLSAILPLFSDHSHCELIGRNPPVNRLWLQRRSSLLSCNCRWELLAKARGGRKGDFEVLWKVYMIAKSVEQPDFSMHNSCKHDKKPLCIHFLRKTAICTETQRVFWASGYNPIDL